MAESLLSPSNILLYGRELMDLRLIEPPPPPSGLPPNNEPPPDGSQLDDIKPDPPDGEPATTLPPPPPPPRLGGNNFLQAQLASPGARLARIYAFSYEGHYYDLGTPAIFLVHGPGRDPEAFRPALFVPGARFSRAPADADRTGVANTPSSFSEDIRVWSYDKGDFST